MTANNGDKAQKKGTQAQSTLTFYMSPIGMHENLTVAISESASHNVSD